MRVNRFLNSSSLPLMLCCIVGGIALIVALVLLVRNRNDQKQMEALVDSHPDADSLVERNNKGVTNWMYPSNGQASGLYVKPEPLK
jgi:hypothetical protein